MIDTLGIQQAARYALMYPETVSHLVLENPIGLEDYREFVPYEPLEDVYRAEMNTSEESIRNYHRNYYVRWKAEYDEYVMVPVR